MNKAQETKLFWKLQKPNLTPPPPNPTQQKKMLNILIPFKLPDVAFGDGAGARELQLDDDGRGD